MRKLLYCAPLLLAACGALPPNTRPIPAPIRQSNVPATPTTEVPVVSAPPAKQVFKAATGGGAFYKDDGPAADIPVDLEAIPEPQPKNEPLHRFANNPYSVLGQDYVPQREIKPQLQRGIASWYGRKFHGQRTSSGEKYDMFGLTAAHPTLPIPSYARVTNVATGKTVVVRVNDRGPFHKSRIMDLSFAAAWRLGYVNQGSAEVEVEQLVPGEPSLTVVASTPMVAPAVAAPTPAPLTTPAKLASADVLPTQPTSAEVRTDAPANVVLPAAAGQHFVQLGAFSNQANAETFRLHIAQEMNLASDSLRLETAGNVVRVKLGPYASKNEARNMANKIAASLKMKPVVTQ